MSEKKAIYVTKLSMPDQPAIEPCATEVGFNLAVYYRDRVACRRCRHWLIEVTTMTDPEPVYLHGHKIPPEIDQGYKYEEILDWIEKRFVERLQSRKTWGKNQVVELFRSVLVEMLFAVLKGGSTEAVEKRDLRERKD